jgi:hypothetical protein
MTLHCILIIYLLITLGGFTYTMTHEKPPFLWMFIRMSYKLMAPFQGYVTFNSDLFVEGLARDGTWKEVNIEPYYPFVRGEDNVRIHQKSFWDKEYEYISLQGYRRLLFRFWKKEEAKGNAFNAMRVGFRMWPRSLGGYTYLKRDPYITYRFITHVP